MKIYISADMEGVVGVVTNEQLGPQGFEYQRFREFMTQEVNAAIEAAFEAGATEIVVSDSHGNGQNLLIEKLPKNVLLVRAWPRPLMMMQGIDETFAGAIFIGYHTGTTNPQGVRAHTISSARLADVRLKGVSVSEAGINAAIAGHFNVPVIMVSGDDAVVKETTKLLGDVEGAVVKWSTGFHSAKTLMPEASYQLIREKVKKAIGRIKDFKPHKLAGPIQVDVRFKNYRPSEVLSYLSIVERTDAHSIRFTGKDDRSVEVPGVHCYLRALVGAVNPAGANLSSDALPQESERVLLSFTAGFSPVMKDHKNQRNRFNGLSVSFDRPSPS